MKVPTKMWGKVVQIWLSSVPSIASMKALPKRKGNLRWLVRACSANLTLNESPSEKEGKCLRACRISSRSPPPSMKVPPKRKGNLVLLPVRADRGGPSMKVPPKRKGNTTD